MKWLLIPFAVFGIVASAALSAAKFNQPNAAFWASRGRWIVACVVVSALTPAAQTFFVYFSERRRRRALELEQSLREFLTGALVAIVRDDATIDCTKAGVHAFLVRRRLRWAGPLARWVRLPWFRKEQCRVSKVKMSFNPPPSGIVWTEGKGVIGRCWETRDNHARDLESWFAPYINATEEEWSKLSADIRYGLSYQEFTRTKGSFGLVAAVPVFGSGGQGRYIGCVSFDLPAGTQAVAAAPILDQLRGCARMLEVLIAQGS